MTHNQPDEPGWTPWVGETWSRWIRGSVLGYRDFVGREAEVRLIFGVIDGVFVDQPSSQGPMMLFPIFCSPHHLQLDPVEVLSSTRKVVQW